VRDRRPVRAFLLGAVGVDVDPLVVLGDVGEFVDAVLVEFLPLADAEFGTDRCDGVVDGRDQLHAGLTFCAGPSI
jgi:hypothetical protein